MVYQAMQDVSAMMGSDWLEANCPLPRIMYLWDEKMINLAEGDFVLIQGNSATEEIFSLYATAWKEDIYLTIDVRTGVSVERAKDLMAEVKRILKANVRKSGYVVTRMSKILELSNELQQMWRFTIDVSLMRVS